MGVNMAEVVVEAFEPTRKAMKKLIAIRERQKRMKPVTMKGKKYLVVIDAALAKKVKEGVA